MSRALRFTLPLLLIGPVACSDQHLTSPIAVNQFARELEIARDGTESWKGGCAGEVQFQDATHLVITGRCQFEHIGRVQFVIHQELRFGQVITYSGTTTYTAPSGDELHTTHTGIATPTADGSGVTLAGTETAISGTGRFAGASGSAAITGISFLSGPRAGTGSYDLLGTISFGTRVGEDRGERELTFMTQNIYQGTDLENSIAATTGQEFVIGATRDFLMMRQTDFSDRAQAMATEIAATQPDLIGLQEVALWRTGPHTSPATPAATIDQDFLQILLNALSARGLIYSAVSSGDNFDVQRPALLSAAGLTDVRLTDRNVILARADGHGARPEISNPQSRNYTTNLVITTVAGPTTVLEGWASIDLKYRGRTVRFITTHLDASAPKIRLAQANELLSGPAGADLPTVVAGDMNTTSSTNTYAALTWVGFHDAWADLHPTDAGFTCCEALPTIDNSTPTLFERVDLL